MFIILFLCNIIIHKIPQTFSFDFIYYYYEATLKNKMHISRSYIPGQNDIFYDSQYF